MMISKNIRLTARTLWRNKLFTALNVMGLSLGIAGSLYILVYVMIDLQWDSFHEKRDRIARIVQIQDFQGTEPQHCAFTMPALGPALEEGIPEIETVIRVNESHSWLRRGDLEFSLRQCRYVDRNFFDVFSLPLVAGDPKTVLSDPNSIVLHEQDAEKWFGNENPIGQTLVFADQREVVVTGLLADPPYKTSIPTRALLPIEMLDDDQKLPMEQWRQNFLATFVLFKSPVSLEEMNVKLNKTVDIHTDNNHFEMYFQWFKDVHLHAQNVKYDTAFATSDASKLLITGSIGLLLIIIAIINYVNLATARAMGRAREIGMRKVIGASRRQLVRQFMLESTILTVFATGFALVLLELCKPLLQEISGRAIEVNLFGDAATMLAVFGLVCLVAFISGFYPALVLSHFQPIEALRETVRRGRGGNRLRRGMVAFQFSVTIAFFICTMIVLQQLRYQENKDPGFDKTNVITLSALGQEFWQKREAFEAELDKLEIVEAHAASFNMPGLGGGQTSLNRYQTDEGKLCWFNVTDADFAEVLRYRIKAGRFLSRDFPSDFNYEAGEAGGIVLNEAAAEAFGFESPEVAIGELVYWSNTPMRIIGVIENYHQLAFRFEIEPMVIASFADQFYYYSIRHHAANSAEIRKELQKVWDEIFPESTMHYFFYDERYNRMFSSEMQFGKLLGTFATLSIIVALLGLIGLTVHSTQRRAKEIGVRRVLGASTTQILCIINHELLLLAIIANVIAWPAAWFLMYKWLGNFVYKTTLDPFIFPVVSVALLIVTLAISTLFAWRTTRANPAEVLKAE